ncbi:hypothetical protein HZB60_09165 [candidate division KSB1 bacterium]|nr:hypothetical protein [candidate division KSB1 bacterium]
MAEPKPRHADEYVADTTQIVVRTSLHLATILGDFQDDIVVIGGMVPYFLVDQTEQPYEQKHIGSMDVDLGLSVALLHDHRYEAIADRLRNSGFEPGTNRDGNVTRQRWRHPRFDNAIVDFLMDANGEPSKLQNLTGDLAAIVTPGIGLAFRDFEQILLAGQTLDGANVERSIKVCGAGALLITKVLALQSRSYGKDAYDIHYVSRNYGRGPEDVAERLRSLLDDETARHGLSLLRQNFGTLDCIGPVKQALFFRREGDEAYQADISGTVMAVVQLCGEPRLPTPAKPQV